MKENLIIIFIVLILVGLLTYREKSINLQNQINEMYKISNRIDAIHFCKRLEGGESPNNVFISFP